MVLDLWLGGQTYNPVIKMLKKRSLAQYVKKIQAFNHLMYNLQRATTLRWPPNSVEDKLKTAVQVVESLSF